MLYNKSGDKMKKAFSFLILIGLATTIAIFHEPIVTFVLNNVIYKREIIIQESNRYALLNNFSFVQETDNFKPTSKQDLKNIIYTYLNRGWNNFSFFCETDIYPSCIDDVKELANDSATLSSINNFVHPYNSYDKLYITLNNLGKVTIETVRLYTTTEQNELNSIIDDIINEYLGLKDKELICGVAFGYRNQNPIKKGRYKKEYLIIGEENEKQKLFYR